MKHTYAIKLLSTEKYLIERGLADVEKRRAQAPVNNRVEKILRDRADALGEAIEELKKGSE